MALRDVDHYKEVFISTLEHLVGCLAVDVQLLTCRKGYLALCLFTQIIGAFQQYCETPSDL